MQSILDRVMKTPYLFISCSLEAAIYGGMKLDVRHGTPSEMDNNLLKIIGEKRSTRTIVFCRSYDEIVKLQEMLSTVMNKLHHYNWFHVLSLVFYVRSALNPW